MVLMMIIFRNIVGGGGVDYCDDQEHGQHGADDDHLQEHGEGGARVQASEGGPVQWPGPRNIAWVF